MLRRPFLGLFVVLALGVVLADFSETLFLVGSASLFGGALLFQLVKKPTKNGIIGLLAIVLILSGYAYRQMELERYKIPQGRTHKFVKLEGCFYGVDAADNQCYDFRATQLQIDGQKVCIHETYRVYLNKMKAESLNGHMVQLTIPDYTLDQVTNPGDFNYPAYLNSMGYVGQFFVDQVQVKDLGDGKRNVWYWLDAIRCQVYGALRESLDRDTAAVIYGMLLGDTRFIQSDVKDDFLRVGIAHILAMSGLHFGIVYGLFQAMQKKWRWRSIVWRPSILLLIWFMAALNGFKPSALRAVVMLSYMIIAPMLGRRYDVLNVMGFIGCASLIKYAGSIYQPGLQLSCVAVLSILYITPIIKARLSFLSSDLKDMIALALGVQVGMWPVLAYHFHYYSIVSYLMNIPAVFLAGILVPMGMLHIIMYFLLPIMTGVTSFFLKETLSLLLETSQFLKGSKWQGLYLPRPSLEVLMMYLWLLIYVVWHRQFERYFTQGRKRWSALLMIVPMLFLVSGSDYTMHPEILFWDVGQGDAALIRYLDQTILIDTGEAENRMYDKLLSEGVYPLDYLVLSHGHSDHAGGAVDILKRLPVEHLVLGAYWEEDPLIEEILKTASAEKVDVVWMDRMDVLEISGGLRFECLGPALEKFKEEEAVNDRSLVLEMEYGDVQCLFTGDIELEGETALLEDSEMEAVELLKVPHHGSNTSSSVALIEKLQPETAIIQVGPNRYGHPNRDIIDLYEEKGIHVYRTDLEGAIKVIVHRDSYDIMSFVD